MRLKKYINFLAVSFIFLISGCATVDISNIGQDGYQLEDDERRMQKRADEICQMLNDNDYLYRDENLANYLNILANKLLPETISRQNIKIEVNILKNPALNAFALPNGKIYIHTGMLAAIENEAQLASLFAHEMTHITNRHALKQFRSQINKSAFLSSIQAPAAAVGGDLGLILAQLAVISSVYGYSKELEYEADVEGFKLIQTQGYDANEATHLFEHLKKFIEDEAIEQPFFFSTHPSVAARIKNYKELIAENTNPDNSQKKIETSVYTKNVRELVLANCNLCLEQGMFKTAQRILDKYLANYPDDALGYFYLGELYRQRQDPEKGKKTREKNEDYTKAIDAYNKAIKYKPHYAQSYKEKGRVLQKMNKEVEAKEAFKKYLEVNPNAEDKEYIEQFLTSNKL